MAREYIAKEEALAILERGGRLAVTYGLAASASVRDNATGSVHPIRQSTLDAVLRVHPRAHWRVEVRGLGSQWRWLKPEFNRR